MIRVSRSIPPRAIFGDRTRPARRRRVNIIGKGKNYGWPVIGYGIDYAAQKFTRAPPGAAWSNRSNTGCRRSPPRHAFYTANCSEMDGSLFTGALAGRNAGRLSLNGIP